MHAFLIRHAAAEEVAPEGDDSRRALTAAGRRDAARMGTRLARRSVRFVHLATSPYLRARETAQALADAGAATSIELARELLPGADLRAAIRRIQRWRGENLGDVALVGHQPDMSRLVEVLLWGEVRGAVEMKKGAVAALELPERGTIVGACRLLWLLTPKML
ncbi:MAG: phosphohistidine phosphatase SixA [Acidobacteriota bacterium]